EGSSYAVDIKNPFVQTQTAPQPVSQAAPQPVPQTAPQTPAQVDTQPKLNTTIKPIPYVYDSKNKKDPFVSILLLTHKEIPKEKKYVRQKGHLTPLEDYELKNIQILAITQLGNEFTATGLLADSRTFPIRVGTRIGKQGGIVTKINLESVIVREVYFDEKGIKTNVETTIQLGR
ncbi:MAG: pilus assembly protein PilP, partial [Nitrospirae bacterium]|nr:pilus assembly protein PilP [Nitrospirota bacterium]